MSLKIFHLCWLVASTLLMISIGHCKSLQNENSDNAISVSSGVVQGRQVSSPDHLRLGPIGQSIFLEGCTLINAGAAGYLPRTVGAFYLAAGTLGVLDASSRREYSESVALGGFFGGLGVYNVLRTQREGSFRWETFEVNLAVGQLIVLGNLVHVLHAEKKENSKKDSRFIEVQPRPGGALALFYQRF